MSSDSQSNFITISQRIIFLLFALILSIILFFLRAKIDSFSPLDKMARESLEPQIALSNGRPTIFEFYADWCEVCREMAPELSQIESEFSDSIDIVLLNVDNNQWNDLVDLYNVNGIPQLNFFDEFGDMKALSKGYRNQVELKLLIESLLNHKEISDFNNLGENKLSPINSKNIIDQKEIGPRNHS